MAKFKPGDVIEIILTDEQKYPEWAGLVVKVGQAEKNWVSGRVLKAANPDKMYPRGSRITFTDADAFTLVSPGLQEQGSIGEQESESYLVPNLQNLVDRIGHVVRKRGWKKNWSSGGCYIHLEVSEFIESLRGKGKSTPEAEAGDVLVALFAVLDWYKIPISEVIQNTDKAITYLEGLEDKPYPGEERGL